METWLDKYFCSICLDLDFLFVSIFNPNCTGGGGGGRGSKGRPPLRPILLRTLNKFAKIGHSIKESHDLLWPVVNPKSEIFFQFCVQNKWQSDFFFILACKSVIFPLLALNIIYSNLLLIQLKISNGKNHKTIKYIKNFNKIYRVAQKNGTVDFLGLCSDQQLSFFTLLDRTSFPHYNNTKIIKIGWKLFILWVISYGLSFSGFAINFSLVGGPPKNGTVNF